MVDFDIEPDDFVRVARIPNLVFRVDEVQYQPPANEWPFRSSWTPRAYLHFVGGAERFDFSMLARWEPLEDLIKLNEMETLAWVSR